SIPKSSPANSAFSVAGAGSESGLVCCISSARCASRYQHSMSWMYWCEERAWRLGSFGRMSRRNSAKVPRQCCTWCSVANAVKSSINVCLDRSLSELMSFWVSTDSDSVIINLYPVFVHIGARLSICCCSSFVGTPSQCLREFRRALRPKIPSTLQQLPVHVQALSLAERFP